MAIRVKIMIVDDHPIVRDGLRKMLSLEEDLEIIAEASNGSKCLRLLEKSSPDLIFMDIRMPGISGVETTRVISEKYPHIKVIMLTIHADDQFVTRAIEAGACGYILKMVKRQELIRIIRQVMKGAAYIDPTLTAGIFKHFQHDREKDKKDDSIKLTQRELEVLNGLVAGRTYRQLAGDLFISEHTIRSHVKSLYKKLGVNSRALAVAKAISMGIVEMTT